MSRLRILCVIACVVPWAVNGCGVPGPNIGVQGADASPESLFRRVDFGELPVLGISFGATWADVDRDGRLDFLLLRHGRGVGVYLTRDQLHFARRDSCEVLPCRVIDQHGTAACDYDNDGDWDLYGTVGARKGSGRGRNELWSQNAQGRYVDTLAADHELNDADGRGRGAVWVRLDDDTYPELLVLNYETRARLFSFDGRSWRDWSDRVSRPAGRRNRRVDWFAYCVAGDLDGDGDADLFLHGSTRRILSNRGDGTLVDVTAQTGLANDRQRLTETAAGDVDNDGDLDLLLSSGAPVKLEVWLNESTPGRIRLRRGPELPLVDPSLTIDSTVLADLDNDGILDLYVMLQRDGETNAPNVVARGRGDGTFEDVTDTWGGCDAAEALPRGVWPVDPDRDGDVDLMLVHGKGNFPERPGIAVLYENTTKRRGLTLELVSTKDAPHGLGARVELRTRNGVQVRQMRAVMRGFSSTVLPLHFGLGDDPGPYTVVVEWPGGRVQEVSLPRGGCAYALGEGAAAARMLGSDGR